MLGKNWLKIRGICQLEPNPPAGQDRLRGRSRRWPRPVKALADDERRLVLRPGRRPGRRNSRRRPRCALFRERSFARYETWRRTRAAYSHQWQEAAADSEYLFYLTAEERAQLGRELQDVLTRWRWFEGRVDDPARVHLEADSAGSTTAPPARCLLIAGLESSLLAFPGVEHSERVQGASDGRPAPPARPDRAPGAFRRASACRPRARRSRRRPARSRRRASSNAAWAAIRASSSPGGVTSSGCRFPSPRARSSRSARRAGRAMAVDPRPASPAPPTAARRHLRPAPARAAPARDRPGASHRHSLGLGGRRRRMPSPRSRLRWPWVPAIAVASASPESPEYLSGRAASPSRPRHARQRLPVLDRLPGTAPSTSSSSTAGRRPRLVIWATALRPALTRSANAATTVRGMPAPAHSCSRSFTSERRRRASPRYLTNRPTEVQPGDALGRAAAKTDDEAVAPRPAGDGAQARYLVVGPPATPQATQPAGIGGYVAADRRPIAHWPDLAGTTRARARLRRP